MSYQDLPPEYFWRFLVIGYLLTIAIETPILLVGLSRGHSFARRLFAGLWLTACTYPIVVLVLPLVVPPLFADPQHGEWTYLAVAETFAPLAECVLFSQLVKSQSPAASTTTGQVAAPAAVHQSAMYQSTVDNPYQSPVTGPRASAANSTMSFATWQDYAAIVTANLTSFLGGEWLFKNVAWLKKLITIES